jgi:phage-related tail fiber protein
MLTLSGNTGVPSSALPFMVGQVCFFATGNAPPGFLICNGAIVSRIIYSELFAAMGTLYGPGDGYATFQLPDLRGEFIRGVDDGRGVDAGRALGSWQADEIRAHTHSYQWFPGDGNGEFDNNYQAGHTQVTGTTGSTGGSETRPRNVALLPCIFVGV